MARVSTKAQPYVHISEGEPPPEGMDVWWRAEDRRYANYDPWADFEQPSGSHLQLRVDAYVVDSYTQKGVWLRGILGDRMFVLGTATKQFAVPTRELAIRDLIARKKRHVDGCRARLARAEEHLEAAEKWLILERGSA
jgi:hypothetical protein